MNSRIVFDNIARFLLLLILQVFVFDYVHFMGFINPNLYVLALLLMPLSLPMSVQYLIGFVTGFIIDLFTMTYGVHASAALWLVALRPVILRIWTYGKKEELAIVPLPGAKPFQWLLSYTFVLVLVHQTLATMLECFTFRRFAVTLGIIVVNALLTTVMILVIEYIAVSAKRKI